MEEEIDKNVGRDMTPRLIGETWRKYPTDISKQKVTYGLFECQYCGKEFETNIQSVRRGHTKSCGCQKCTGLITHGVTKHRLYHIWFGLVDRCTNPNHNRYKDYGGRGITVCEEWLDVKNFIEDMYPSYMEGLSLDRIDNDKGYSLDNCRWVDASTQALNQRIQKNNTSGFVGVSYHNGKARWSASVGVKYKKAHIGHYSTIEEAVQARDQYIIDNKLPNKLSTDYVKES